MKTIEGLVKSLPKSTAVVTEHMNVAHLKEPLTHLLEFYPGGTGVLVERKGHIPDNCVMIIGQDFGTVAYYDKLKKDMPLDEKLKYPLINTWRKMISDIIEPNAIKPDKCFFTNPINGLRKANQPMTGKNKGLGNADFVNECADYIKAQISYVKPKSIIILGKAPIAIFKSAFPDSTFKDVDENKTFKQLDEDNLLFHSLKVKINNEEHSFNACIIIHPSMRNSNKNNYLLIEENGVSPERRLLQQLN